MSETPVANTEPGDTGSVDTTSRWREVGQRTWILRDAGYGVNIGLVVGTERALVIETGAGPAQAAAILDAVRELTSLPVTAVNTHSHFSHASGNAYFAAHGVDDIWATARCAGDLAETGERQRPLASGLEPAMTDDAGPHTSIRPANRVVEGSPVDLDLGGISVTLFHLGRGHTDNDLLVGAGSVLFTGDLVEEGGDPGFADSYPADWIRTLGKIAALEDLYDVFVPGHGNPVGVEFVTAQLYKMRTAVRVTKVAMDEASVDMTKAIPILPYGPEQSRALLIRLRTLAQWKW
ncbi:MBL fold metallo-hydrolase [Arthrobacter sp. HLT1-21]